MWRAAPVILSIWAGCGGNLSPGGANPGGDPTAADDASAGGTPDDLGVSGTIDYADLAWTDLASASTDLASPVTPTSLPPGTTVTGIWGTGADNLYLATNAKAVYHIGADGVPRAQAVPSGLFAITGSDAHHMWAITVATVLFSSGDGTWTMQHAPNDPEFLYVTGIWASGPNDIYATGIRKGGFGAIYHSAGDGYWTAQQATGTRMYAVWGRSSSDVYAVGWSHQVFHTTGNGKWTDLSAQFSGSFTAVWGNATDMFIAGSSIYRSHAGGAWTVDGSGGATSWDIRGVWGSASDNAWAVGTGGLLLHRGASGWSAVASNTRSDLFAVWGTDASDVWIGGADVFGQLH